MIDHKEALTFLSNHISDLEKRLVELQSRQLLGERTHWAGTRLPHRYELKIFDVCSRLHEHSVMVRLLEPSQRGVLLSWLTSRVAFWNTDESSGYDSAVLELAMATLRESVEYDVNQIVGEGE